MSNSRTYNSLRNLFWYIFSIIITSIMPFITRSLLINYIGIEYTGISSLFSSFLQILNLADIGIGNALVVFLYKPMVEKKNEEIESIISSLRKCYKITGIIILGIGLLLVPFISMILEGKTYPSDINIYYIYFIYVLNAAIPYILNWYIEILFRADQRSDILYKLGGISALVMYIFQIVMLTVYKNFFLYTAFILANPIIYSLFLFGVKRKYYKRIKVVKKQQNFLLGKIYRKVLAIGLSKFRDVSRNSFDNIVISKMLGLTIVAQYQNYYQVMCIPMFAISAIRLAVTPSFGNSIALNCKKSNYDILKLYTFVQNGIAVICATALFSLYQPFMKLWVGEKYLLSQNIVALFCIYFYVYSLVNIPALLRDVTGIWWQGAQFSILEALLNFLFNIIFIKYWGISGAIISTILTMLFWNIPIELHYIFKEYFEQTPKEYAFILLKYIGQTGLIFGLSIFLIGKIANNLGENIIIKAIFSIVIPTLFFVAFNIKNPQMHELKNKIVDSLKSKKI